MNSVKTSWSVEFEALLEEASDSDGEDLVGECSQKDHTTLLHEAIGVESVDLVRLLVAKGADVNQNKVFS